MRSKFLQFLFIGFFFLSSFSVFSQFQIGIGGIYTMRMGEFKNSNYKDGYGAMFSLYSSSLLPKKSPVKLRIGFGINGSNAGSEKYEVETSVPANNTAKIRFKNNNNAAFWGLRLEKKFSRIAVYGDGVYGTRNLHSIRKIQLLDDPEENYEDEVTRVTESKRVFFGFGAGLSYYLTENVMLDFSALYTKSNSFTYLSLVSLEQDLNQICYKYETAKSSDVLTFNLGFKFNLVGLSNKNSSNSGNSGSSTSSSSSNNGSSNDSGSTKKSPVKKAPKKKIKIKTNPGGGGSGGADS